MKSKKVLGSFPGPGKLKKRTIQGILTEGKGLVQLTSSLE
jgi:hypothetical protein